MVEAIRRILLYTRGVEDQRILDDPMRADALLFRFTVLGEAAKRVPEQVRSRNPGIPWAQAARLRDKIAHDYFGIDADVITQVVRHELPTLLPLLEALLAEEDARA